MKQLQIRMAEIQIDITAEHEQAVESLCQNYITSDSPEHADFSIHITNEQIQAEDRASGHIHTPGYLENVCICREVCFQIPTRGAFMFHAAVISDGQWGYAFAAPSGVGKSTHIKLWRQVFGPSIQVINGDKPFMRQVKGQWHAYGTPWCGKEMWHTPGSVPLAGVCFLSRSADNRIRSISPADAIDRLFRQTVLPPDPAQAEATLALLDSFISELPLYDMTCTISPEAARMAYQAMRKPTVPDCL